MAAGAGAGIDFCAAKDFKWERMGHLEQMGTKLRMKEGPKKAYAKKYVCLVLNYLVIFKEPKTDRPGPKDLGALVLELERTTGDATTCVQMVQGDKGGDYVFSVACGGKMYFFACESMTQLQSWMGAVQNHMRRMMANPRENSDLLNNKLTRAQTSLRSEVLKQKTPVKVEPKDGAEWIRNILELKRLYAEHAPTMKTAALYYEFVVNNQTKRYIDYFNDEVGGPLASITKSETAVLADWQQRLEKGPGDMAEATKRYFFYEDIKPFGALGRVFKALVEVYDSALVQLRGESAAAQYAPLIAHVDQLLAIIEATPTAASVRFDGFADGQMLNATQTKKWAYYKYDGIVKTEVHGPEIPEPCTWEVKGAHIYQHPTLYGTVMWNGKTWVWTHADFPFLIRYEYDEASGIFQQNNLAVPKDMGAGPVLVDWQLQGTTLRAVTVGQKATQPHIPEDVEWTISNGPIPPSIALLIASMYIIKPLVKRTITHAVVIQPDPAAAASAAAAAAPQAGNY